jgi:hypothetical protein
MSRFLLRILLDGDECCPAVHIVYTGRWERAGFCAVARVWGVCHVPLCTTWTWSSRALERSEDSSIQPSSPCWAINGWCAFLGAPFLFVEGCVSCRICAVYMISVFHVDLVMGCMPYQLRRGGGSLMAPVSFSCWGSLSRVAADPIFVATGL